MSRRMDTSSTTQMSEIMGKNFRFCGSSWTKFVWSSIRRIAMVKTIRRSVIKTWVGESTELGMYVRSSETRIDSVRIRGWLHNGGQKQNMALMWMESMKKRYWRTNIISWRRLFGLHSTWMQSELFWDTRKLLVWQTPPAQTVAWSYDMEEEVQKYFTQYCEFANKKVARMSWKIVRSLLTICLEMLVLGARVGRLDKIKSTSFRDLSQNGLGHPTNVWQGWFLTLDHTKGFRQYCRVGKTAQHSNADLVCFKIQTLLVI